MGSSANTNQQETVLFASAVMRLLYASAHAPRKIENAVQNAAQSAPVQNNAPVQKAPVQKAPAQNAPAQNAPAQKVPAPEAVKPEASVPKATVQEVPVTETPAQKAEEPEKAKKAETAKKPEKQEAAAPVTEVPAEQAPIEQAPAEQVPAEQAPVEQLPAVETEEEEAFVEETEEEKKEIRQSFWQKLKNGLAKTRKAIFGSIDDLLKNFVKVDEDLLEELEELLITSDISVDVTEDIIDQLRDRIKDGRLTEKEQVMGALREILTDMIGKEEPLHLDTVPSVILVIGVNGAGKTTSIGKISKRLRLSGKKVVVAAADTFRAAAIDQLAVWCERAHVDLVKQAEGSDPASVVYDAIGYVKNKHADVLIIDTAGRLHNKANLMNELAKINHVIDRELPGACRETLLVLDATTGQNAIVQAVEFKKAAPITGITLNKLDGTAKGGIVISIKKELGIPVKFVGVGEKIDDMQEFDAEEFVKALFS